MLIVINGPIASGKSTIARATATELTRRGESVAVIDVDVLYDMLDHRRGAQDLTTGHGALRGPARRR